MACSKCLDLVPAIMTLEPKVNEQQQVIELSIEKGFGQCLPDLSAYKRHQNSSDSGCIANNLQRNAD